MAIDAAMMEQLKALEAEGTPGFLAELIDLFAHSTPARLVRMRECVSRGDAVALEHESHALKGSCGSLGATGMMHLASELEQRARALDLSDALSRLDALLVAFEEVHRELKSLLP